MKNITARAAVRFKNAFPFMEGLELADNNETPKSNVGRTLPVSKLIIEFQDGSTHVVLTDEGPIYYRETTNNNRAKKNNEKVSWTEHEVWWQGGHYPTVG